MVQRVLIGAIVIAGAAVSIAWTVARPQPLEQAAFQGLMAPDLANGELIYHASGCASCHSVPGAEGEDRLLLAGGLEIESDFGTFRVPNISSDPEAGIGAWSFEDFANAVLRGVSPQGDHYYPAFPYASYTRMTIGDVNDLWGFMQSLPASDAVSQPHELAFPYSMRQAVGLWKYLYMDNAAMAEVDTSDPQLMRGRYLVEALAHCGECHTPRDALGGFVPDMWLAGAANPDGEGTIPNITPGSRSMGNWSASDIAYYLESGFTPDFDSVGGSMAAVQRNMERLPASDREAIAAYLKAIPERTDGYTPSTAAAQP
jgi:mono/diheme cytochrome c family protein